jgi:adenylate cyclase
VSGDPDTAEPSEPTGTGMPDNLALSDLVEVIERTLLRGPLRFTREEVSERAGTSSEESRALWRALGFPTVADDQKVFTDADIEALQGVRQLVELGDIDDDLMRAMTRIIGQSFARLASWQGQLVLEIVGRRPDLIGSGGPDEIAELIAKLTPLVEQLHDYVWRRQLAAYFSRVASNAGVPVGVSASAEHEMAVGFADMADFTGFTRRSSEAELRGVLDAFEALATDVVGDHRGQIVKTIGDEVLFTADDPQDAAEIALELLERAEADDRLPPLRAGVAFGRVVRRLGDVFGQPVNIASRLTTIARTGAVVVDEQLATRLETADPFVVHPMRPVSVRGYRHLRAARLRRAAAERPAANAP